MTESLQISFYNTLNSRFVGERYRLIRSDSILSFNQNDVDLLKYYNIKNIIDLRSKVEIYKNVCCYPEFIKYKNIPLHIDGILPTKSADVGEFYFSICKDGKAVGDVLSSIADADGGTVYFCHSGKDRTGIITGIILALSGYSDEYIAHDYSITEKYLNETIEKWLITHPQYEKEAVYPRERHILTLLSLIRREYDSVENYCLKIGLDPTQILRLQRMCRFLK